MLRLCGAVIRSGYGSAAKSKLFAIRLVQVQEVFLPQAPLVLAVWRVSVWNKDSLRCHCIRVFSFATTLRIWQRNLTSASRPLDVRLQVFLQWLGIKVPHIVIRLPRVATWRTIHPNHNLRLTRYSKGITCAHTYRRYSAELIFAYRYHAAEYNKGSNIQG